MTQTLSDALTRLRNLKSQISRVTEIIKASTVHDEDKAPEYNYADELATRIRLDDEIVALKARIQRTNAQTQVTFEGAQKTLSELILRNARIRSDLAFYAELGKEDEMAKRYRGLRTKDTVREVNAPGFSKPEVRKTIERLESEKEALDSFLNGVNLRTTVVTD